MEKEWINLKRKIYVVLGIVSSALVTIKLSWAKIIDIETTLILLFLIVLVASFRNILMKISAVAISVYLFFRKQAGVDDVYFMQSLKSFFLLILLLLILYYILRSWLKPNK